jgi:hypothetical protein
VAGRHLAAAAVALVLGALVPAGFVSAATPVPAPTTAGTAVGTTIDIAPPPVIDELIDPADRKPDGPGRWVGTLALVAGVGVVVAAFAVVRRRPDAG